MTLPDLGPLLEAMKANLKKTHSELMSGMTPEQREDTQQKIDAEVDKFNDEHGSAGGMNDFISEIYSK